MAICGYIEPLSAVLLSVIFLREMLFPLQMVGALLIVGGAFMGEGVFQKNSCNSLHIHKVFKYKGR